MNTPMNQPTNISPKRQTKFSPLWVLPGAALSAAALYWLWPAGPAASPPTPSVLVSTLTLTPGQLAHTIQAYGTITPGPGAEHTITAHAALTVSQIFVTQGQAVSTGTPLLRLAPDPQSIADLHKAQSAVSAASANRAHVAALLATHLATTADLAAATQTLADATSTLAALQASGTGQPGLIKAPFSGIITAISATTGALQPPGAALLRIVNTQALVATTATTPADAALLHLNDPAQITPINGGTPLSGHLTAIAAMPDAQSGLITLTLSLNNQASPALGAPVAARITTATLNGFVVPRDCVQSDDQGNYVYQTDKQNIAHREAVTILATSGAHTLLAPSLNAAMPLVTTGAYQLNDGAAVRTTP